MKIQEFPFYIEKLGQNLQEQTSLQTWKSFIFMQKINMKLQMKTLCWQQNSFYRLLRAFTKRNHGNFDFSLAFHVNLKLLIYAGYIMWKTRSYLESNLTFYGFFVPFFQSTEAPEILYGFLIKFNENCGFSRGFVRSINLWILCFVSSSFIASKRYQPMQSIEHSSLWVDKIIWFIRFEQPKILLI